MQRRRYKQLAVSIFALATLKESISHSSELAFSRNARTNEAIQSSLMTKGLGHACLTILGLKDSLPCQPGYTAQTKKPHLQIQGLISNGYPVLDKMKKLLSGEVSQELVDALFAKDRILQIEGNTELDFFSKYLNAKYTPASIKYFSVTRNEANPDVEVFAVEEKNFVLQSGYQMTPELSVGAQIRSIDRTFVRKRLKLLDLATQAGKDLLKPQKISSIFFEPSIAYISDTIWKWRLSGLISNLGYSSASFNDFPLPISPEFGFGFSPPLIYGNLEVGIDYKSLSFEEPPIEKIHLGMLYNLGAMYLVSGFDFEGISGGVFYGLEQLNAGIVFTTTQVPWKSSDFYAQTVYLQVGWQI
jgi:hypothetical protein